MKIIDIDHGKVSNQKYFIKNRKMRNSTIKRIKFLKQSYVRLSRVMIGHQPLHDGEGEAQHNDFPTAVRFESEP